MFKINVGKRKMKKEYLLTVLLSIGEVSVQIIDG